ncbi:endonuclease/exonuclease/phosphatase family protein [Lacinutrix sp. 5H-3-7-4]|uniref:endonuclease/exonuclease/phosphatase family protein n=1 Tax=Lacinutrix sp. (strain 5H-3-7-4) TaxID=983544 RepID=UPI00020A38EA|nr:endonuclease/exonuclease/phosphatase family protein [Lacinutrix sp. 5H-3-7-4]AEH02126.1 Endonuclease/exonuclease/phosphatase [Lacinutrix sp. 5H-3-7-4]
MRIITWNCNGAFRKKFKEISSLNAEVYVIQECEDPLKSNHKEYKLWADNYLWIGDNKNKGVGVFAKPNIDLKKLDWSENYNDHRVKYFLPCKINNNFDLLALWNHSNNSPTFGYIGQFWKYLQINKSNLKKCIILGDFNSNKIWDKWDRWWNHSDVLEELSELGIESLYHMYFNEEQGKESKPTFFLQRKLTKPYHIDYIFGSTEFIKTLNKIEVGNSSHWLKLSDHNPIITDFEQNW